MRIAQVSPGGLHPYSGVLSVIRELAEALAQRGHDVEVWQLSDWPSHDTYEFEASLAAAGVELVEMPVANDLVLGGRMAKALAARQPDVVHLHNTFSPPNNLLARRLDVPYILTAHGGYAAEQLAFHRWRKRAWRALFERRLLAEASILVALTPFERAELKAFAPGVDAEVVPNGVRPPPKASGAAFRKRLGIGEEPLAVFTGKLDHHHKRVGELVAGAAEAPDWHVALVGPDWRNGRARLERQVSRLGLWDRVHLVRPLRGEALHEAYAAADVFLLMSRWEGLSISLLEALSHGVPAIVSAEVEQRLRVAASGAGWLASGGLGAALRHLEMLDPAAWKKRRDAAYAYAARHNWDQTAAHYEALYRRALRLS